MTRTPEPERAQEERQHPNGHCRYCGEPRPAGYGVTCGRSECQEAAYNDKERRSAPGRRRQ